MNQPEPTPEAVEAALSWVNGRACDGAQCDLIRGFSGRKAGKGLTNHAIIILAAEVRRLRGDVGQAQSERDEHKRKVDQMRLDKMALSNQLQEMHEEIEQRGKEYDKALNRRVDVENTLYQVAAGKRGPLTPNECRELANKLGVSPA